jgi:hypothetical protein
LGYIVPGPVRRLAVLFVVGGAGVAVGGMGEAVGGTGVAVGGRDVIIRVGVIVDVRSSAETVWVEISEETFVVSETVSIRSGINSGVSVALGEKIAAGTEQKQQLISISIKIIIIFPDFPLFHVTDIVRVI